MGAGRGVYTARGRAFIPEGRIDRVSLVCGLFPLYSLPMAPQFDESKIVGVLDNHLRAMETAMTAKKRAEYLGDLQDYWVRFFPSLLCLVSHALSERDDSSLGSDRFGRVEEHASR